MRSQGWVAVLCLCASGPASAKTPDGEPPSVETVCDDFRGAAFGLCNAYCEAMDCTDPNQHADDRACERVKTRFQIVTGLEDMPCEAGVCSAYECDWGVLDCQHWLDYECRDATPDNPCYWTSCNDEASEAHPDGCTITFTNWEICSSYETCPPEAIIDIDWYWRAPLGYGSQDPVGTMCDAQAPE